MARLSEKDFSAAARSPCATCTSPTLFVRHRQIALPGGVAGIGLHQSLPDGEAVGKGFQRSREVALRHLHVADFVI